MKKKKTTTGTKTRTTNPSHKKNKDQIKINNIESEIEEIEQHHQTGAMIRSRTKHIENEERPLKFFYAAEKQNQNKKNITKLKNKNGELKTEGKEILKIAKEFYSDLYKKAQKNEQEQEHFLNKYNKKISNDWHPNLTEPLEENELFQALKSMEENKSPGKDGIPMEFYRKFWPIIKNDFKDLMNHIFLEKRKFQNQ